MEDNWFASKGS